MTKAFIIGLLLAFAANCRCKSVDHVMKDFEEEFHQVWNDEAKEEEAAECLKEAIKEMEENNAKFEKGESTFTEDLEEWSDIPDDVFKHEKLGLIEASDVGSRSTGLLPTEDWEKEISPESRAILDNVYAKYDRQSLPESFDARDNGWVTPVKNQGSCGSCAAFSATVNHETCMIKTGAALDDMDLSEQQLLDCAYHISGANACNGATLSVYQRYMAETGQVNHEKAYGYLETRPNLVCQNKAFWNPGAKVTDALYEHNCGESQLMKLVYEYGSVTTGIYASSRSFQQYRSGVYQGCGGSQANHAVAVVGWGTENGVDYWLVKNSWGTRWGDNGYVKIRRGTNECQIGTSCVAVSCESTGDTQPSSTTPNSTDNDDSNTDAPDEEPASTTEGTTDIVPAPTDAPEDGTTDNRSCDLSSLFKRYFGEAGFTPGVMYQLRIWIMSGGQYRLFSPLVYCDVYICEPVSVTIQNGCEYMCGSSTC